MERTYPLGRRYTVSVTPRHDCPHNTYQVTRRDGVVIARDISVPDFGTMETREEARVKAREIPRLAWERGDRDQPMQPTPHQQQQSKHHGDLGITPYPAAFLAAAVRNLQQLNADLARSEDSGLSPAELDFLPEAAVRPWKPKGLPVAEIDCDLRIPGQGEIAVTLSVWGRFTPALKGGHEPGERAYEPDDEAGFEIEAVMWGDTDVTGEIGQRGQSALCAYVMENCEPDTPPEPELGHFCEDRR